tara:strand:- start:983 stop:1489 length:507 start_codon:yes stop_codon:yes gene_type:complete
MAHNATAGISATILRDEVKSKLTGQLNQPGASGNWVYKTDNCPVSPATLFNTNDEFFGNLTASDSVAATDPIYWLAIKNLGIRAVGGNTKTTEGIMINYAGAAPIYNGTDSNDNSNMLIGPGELFVVRFNGVLVEDVQIGTVAFSGFSKASSIGLNTVAYSAAAIIDG